FLDKKIREGKRVDPALRKLVIVIKDVVLRGGKRLRPAFLYFAYQACGGKDKKAALYTSQAIEFLHTAALIHDDIIDQSLLRRGKPAAHLLLGESGAILAGDLCF
ncbi:MAG: polyprenyl synthetase family protein, partial [Candidatus Aminicenantes bacterium]|nr:polyprenyl synthetase family protein [Candidatus Aminicenantes bacterium]NIO81844.1 polyprenyl synthetase family protein [Candidatus Aminicenantes bacterium]NIQ67717.1 polyprenyl synthetase family protein [Candidatus Aminicenantes bacterium]NIR06354.1 polyprenyl synthetase family protein [Candidatus Aminicenantes bacterium]